MKLPSHIRTADVFNVKHLIPMTNSCSDDDSNSRENSFQAREEHADSVALAYMEHRDRFGLRPTLFKLSRKTLF